MLYLQFDHLLSSSSSVIIIDIVRLSSSVVVSSSSSRVMSKMKTESELIVNIRRTNLSIRKPSLMRTFVQLFDEMGKKVVHVVNE